MLGAARRGRWAGGRHLAAIAFLAVWAAACQGPPAPSSLTLGTTLPLSSRDSAEVALAWERGYQRAVDEVNAAGGVALEAWRRRVRVALVVRDDGGNLAEAEQGAEELLAAGAEVLLATPGFVRMAVQAAVARRYERPYVIPLDAAPQVLATAQPWVVVAADIGSSPEDTAYRAAKSALDALSRARALNGEAVRRAFASGGSAAR